MFRHVGLPVNEPSAMRGLSFAQSLDDGVRTFIFEYGVIVWLRTAKTIGESDFRQDAVAVLLQRRGHGEKGKSQWQSGK